MGGSGSGWRASSTTSGYLRLAVRYLQRNRMLEQPYSSLNWSRNGEQFAWISLRAEPDSLVLIYKHRRNDCDEWRNKEYPVGIEWTPCHYGGKRAWFRCPVARCGRRVAVLYGGEIFACRQCRQLVYESQRERPYGRVLSRAQKIRRRLGGTGSMADLFPLKPRGMHWLTYERLCAEYDQHDRLYYVALARMLKMQ